MMHRLCCHIVYFLSGCLLPSLTICAVDSISSNIIANTPDSGANPFQLYMLPLTYEHSNLLHAVLGFAASHISRSSLPRQATLAIEHKVLAIQSLSSLLIKEQCLGLTPVEEDITLSAVLLLLLQDVSLSLFLTRFRELNHLDLRIRDLFPWSAPQWRCILVL